MNACISAEDVSNTRYQRVSRTGSVIYTRILWWIIPLELWEINCKGCLMIVLIGSHFSGGVTMLLALHQIPLQPNQLSPECFESDNYRKYWDCHNYSENERMYIGWGCLKHTISACFEHWACLIHTWFAMNNTALIVRKSTQKGVLWSY